MRNLSIAAVELWGLEDQMMMVAEEAVEVAHAVMKWRRANKRYNKAGVTLSRENLSETEVLRKKAHENELAQRVLNLQTEAMQMLYMIDQLQVMLPGKYEDILQKVLMDARAKIIERGGRIHE